MGNRDSGADGEGAEVLVSAGRRREYRRLGSEYCPILPWGDGNDGAGNGAFLYGVHRGDNLVPQFMLARTHAGERDAVCDVSLLRAHGI